MQQQKLSQIARLKEALERYGLTDDLDRLLQAIRSSYLTDGTVPREISGHEGEILRQLGVGWPALSEDGKRIGRELVDAAVGDKRETLERIVSQYPPRVIALFLQASQRTQEVSSLRIPEEAQRAEPLGSFTALTDVIRHEKLHAYIFKLAEELSDHGLAVTFKDRAYRGAKWVARFIYIPLPVSDVVSKLLAQRRATLEDCEQAFNQLLLLRRSPIPPVRELEVSGLTPERLNTHLSEALANHVVTKIADTGPAFLVLNQEQYERIVLHPIFDRIIETFLEKTPLPGSQRGPSSQPASAEVAATKELQPMVGGPIIIGAQKLGPQWGILGRADSTPVTVDLNAPHVAFVCGKMGTGKGYTIGVLCEMLAGKAVPDLTCIQRPATVIVLYKPREDLPSEFSTIVQPNDNPQEVSELQKVYQQAPRLMVQPENLRVFIDPFVYQKNRTHFERQYPSASIKPLYADPSSLSGQEWSIVLSAGERTDQLYVKRLFAILERLQYEPFNIARVLSEVINDPVMDNRQKKLAQQRMDVLRNYLAGPSQDDFVRNLAVGGVNIFDFRQTIRTADDVFSLMTLVISILQTKKGLEEEPFIFVINEAHDYFKGGVSADFVESIEHLIRRRRHGKNWLLLDTHFPDDVDDRVVQLADLKFVHYLDKATASPVLNRAFGHATVEFSTLKTGEAFIEADQSSQGLSKVFRVAVRPRLTKHGGATKTAI